MNFRSRRVLGAVAACGLAAVAVGYFAFPRETARIANVPVQAVQRFFVPEPQTLFGKSEIRVLLVGLDYDYDNKDQETSKQSRSDIIMAIGLDFRDRRISELSVPRDMVATLPNGRLGKINQAQSEGGIAESQAVIAQWLGIPPFDRYVVLRIDAAKDVVNAIGGVDVEVKNANALRGTGKNGRLDYDDHWGHLSIHLPPGRQHLDGEQAVAYARFRHDWCSDPCRIMRQQQMIRAVLDKVERNQFNTVTHVQQLLAVLQKDVDTNFTVREEASLAVAFSHLSPKAIATAQVPYVRTIDLPDYGDSLVADDAEKARLVASLLGGTRVRVENGTTVPGLAARVAGELRRSGFTVAEVRDAPSHDVAVTQITSGGGDSSAPYRVRSALGPQGAAAVIRTAAAAAANDGVDVTVVLGSDIVGGKP
ncbi:MAG TPA: LCP family protein [Candidatus Elarobacter sp.]|jgi:LCP family protein required for cell wall assembly|nr:LCP family protein [Candidatus Elarobacter sp.]